MLARSRVLLVEDEALVANVTSELPTEAEGVPVGPAGSVSEARQPTKDGPPLDAALLDVSLGDGLVTPVLEALSAWGIPTLVCTGGGGPGGDSEAPSRSGCSLRARAARLPDLRTSKAHWGLRSALVSRAIHERA